jgi:hypothetical protein
MLRLVRHTASDVLLVLSSAKRLALGVPCPVGCPATTRWPWDHVSAYHQDKIDEMKRRHQ